MNSASIPNLSFLGSLEVTQIYLPGWVGGWVCGWVGGWVAGWVGLTVIIGLVSVQLALNLPTGTELGNFGIKVFECSFGSKHILASQELEHGHGFRRLKLPFKMPKQTYICLIKGTRNM